MFSPGSVDKNSTLAECPSPGRSKFPVGINPLGDESQQNIRIQLAVHRYNNTTSGSFIRPVNDRSMSSPFKQAFLRNSPKFKSFENDKEEQQNNLKKSHNQYQGVGNFPLVHLKKNTVISRPVKRTMSNEFKIQLPELPFNRFLQHSPDACLSPKTSTRSVLDVLQDLSRKRIHTKDDSESTKRKCKGLGGDAPLDIEAPYKPLFVPKSKTNAVILKDCTTQTQELPPLEPSPTKKSEPVVSNVKDDPKAELRRKLARQNNEIFASLSSSTLTYPIRKYSEKFSQIKVGDDMEQRGKKAKHFSEDKTEKKTQNGDLSSKDVLKAGITDDQKNKNEKKQKMADANKSPNKDRLTTIFLEMKSFNPKVEVLGKNQTVNEKDVFVSKSPDRIEDKPLAKGTIPGGKNSHSENSQGTGSAVESPKQNDNSNSLTIKNDTSEKSKSNHDKIKNVLNAAEENDLPNGKETTENEKNYISSTAQASPRFVLPTSSVTNISTSSTSPFKMPLASTVSSSMTQMPIFSIGISPKGNSFVASSGTNGVNDLNVGKDAVKNVPVSSIETSSPSQKISSQAPGSGNGETASPGIGSSPGLFKFGTGETKASRDETSSTIQKESSETGPKEVDNAAKGPTNSASSVMPCKGEASSQSPLSGFSSSISNTTGSQSLFMTNSATITTATTTTSQRQPDTSVFTFSSQLPNSGNQKSEEKSNFQFGFSQTGNSSLQFPMFKTGEITPTAKSDEKPAVEKSNSVTLPSFTQSTFSSNSFSATTSSSTSSFGSTQLSSESSRSIMPFKFGDSTNATSSAKPSHEIPSSSTSSNLFDKSSSNIFTFGQKTQGQDVAVSGSGSSSSNNNSNNSNSSSQPVASTSNLFQQNVFTFGQKSTTPASSASQTIQSTNLFGQNASTPQNLFQSSVVSQSSTTVTSVLNSSTPFGLTTQASDSLKQNQTQGSSIIPTTSSGTPAGISSMNSTFTQNKLSMPSIGQSTPTFGQTATSSFSSAANIFGSSSSQNPPSFGATPSSQNNPFSQTFGDNGNKQPNQTSNFFMQTPTTQSSGFPQSSAFGSTTFGQNATTENSIFGQKAQISGLESNQNVPGTSFGQNSAQQNFQQSQMPFTFGTAPASSTSGFALNTQTTTASVFTFGSSTKTTSASSTFGFSSGSSQPNSSSQSVFTFTSQPTTAFKFGSTANKESPAFGSGSGSSTFSFSLTPSVSEPSKPVFNFGASQTPATHSGFNFGATQSPVFSFGGSGSSTSSSSRFSFGASQPNTGIFTPGATPSPSTVSLPGIFSIGSGSSQPRSRSSAARLRRRP